MTSEDSLDSAYRMATHDGSRRPRQADLCTAVNRIYYALFRAFCECFANAMVGTSMSARNLPEWERAFRALDHGRARKACRNFDAMKHFPEVLREFAKIFADAQLKRQIADYASKPKFFRADVIESIEIARNAIRNLKSCDLQSRRAFLAYVALPDRGFRADGGVG